MSVNVNMHRIFTNIVLSCQDPHLIAEILSNPRLTPYCSTNSILTILCVRYCISYFKDIC